MSKNEIVVNTKSAEEMAEDILQAVGQENHPIKGLIVAGLEKWETSIRLQENVKDLIINNKNHEK
jgi:hypothetical protein